jgi:LysR family glycine cleavage system transcriptional activator
MSSNLPPLKLLETFEIAAKHLNGSRAAKELCVTQAAVSRQILQLEDYLQCKLFLRNSRGLLLTYAGEQYLTEVIAALDIIRRATSDLKPGYSSGDKHQLIVGVDAAFSQAWLIKRLGDFYEGYPNIEVEIVTTKALAVLSKKPMNGVDVQIVYGVGPWPEFQAVKLLEFEIFPVCSPSMPGVEALSKFGDLENYNLLHEETHYYWHRWLDFVGATEVDSNIGPVIHDTMSCLQMAVERGGLAIGDNLTCADFFSDGSLIRPFKESIALDETFYLLVRDGRKELAEVKDFQSWLLKKLSPCKV